MFKWRYNNIVPGNSRGKKIRQNGKVLPRYSQYDKTLKRWIKFWSVSERVGGEPNWYKPKGAPTKRGNKRGQSKPR